jgi:hypothetical protein
MAAFTPAVAATAKQFSNANPAGITNYNLLGNASDILLDKDKNPLLDKNVGMPNSRFLPATAQAANTFTGIDYELRDELLGALLDENNYSLFDQNQR